MKAVTVLLFGLGLGLSSAKASCGKPGGPEATADSSKPTAETAPVTLEGVNTNVLTPRERKEFSGYVTKFDAPCSDFKGTIAACIQSKNSCKACLPAAQFVLRAVRDGKTDTQPNADGVLPELMRAAGFPEVREAEVVPTVNGTISIYVAVKG